jgi:hypothetical protein
MPQAGEPFEEICNRFSQVYWHDSKLLNISLIKDLELRQYDLELDINLRLSGAIEPRERARRKVSFRDCRIVQINLDLLGVLLCGGDIGGATCHQDARKLEESMRNMVSSFDLRQETKPIESCLGFKIQMIPPGGDIVVLARNFEII